MSRKFTFAALGVSLMAVSAMANVPQQMKKGDGFINPALRSEIKSTGNIRLRSDVARKLPARLNSADDVISNVEGVSRMMSAVSSGTYTYIFWTMAYQGEESAIEMVEDGDDLYFKDIIPFGGLETYVKGKKDSDKVVIDLPQTVYWEETYADGFNLVVFDEEEYEEDGEIYVDYVVNNDVTSVSFTVAADGSMVLDLEEGQSLGYAYCTDDWFTGYSVSEMTLAPFNEVAVSVPEDVEVSENFWNYMELQDYGWTVNFAQGENNEVYFGGLSQYMPDGWFKGEMVFDGDDVNIEIAQDQYVGIYSGSFIWTKVAKYVVDDEGNYSLELMPADYKYVLNWDYEENVLRPADDDPDIVFVLNAASDRVYYLQLFEGLTLTHQDGFAGVPATPYNLYYEESMADYGYNAFTFCVPAVSTEGDLLLTDNLYYVVYVDGDEFEFDAEEYEIPETLTQVPFNLAEYYIYNKGTVHREVDFFMEGMETLGVQSVYYCNGEETRSEIATLDLSGTGVKELSGKEVSKVVFYDLSGRVVANPEAGIYVRRATCTDGTVVTSKVVVK